MATFYNPSNANNNNHVTRRYYPPVQRQNTIAEVLRMKGLQVARRPDGRQSWVSGDQCNPNTPLANMLSERYTQTESVHQALRQIASKASRYGLISYDATNLPKGEVKTILNSMMMQGILESANFYDAGVYVSLTEGAGDFLKKNFAILHIVDVLKHHYGQRLSEIYYGCKLQDLETGNTFAVDIIYRIGNSVSFVNVALNPNIMTMENYKSRHAGLAERLRSAYHVVLSPNVNPVLFRSEIGQRFRSDRTQPITAVCFHRLEYLLK